MSSTLEHVRALAPEIADRAEETERARAVPKDLVEQLLAAGVFRMYVPRSHGGDQLSASEGLEVVEETARADGSVGWITMIGASSPAFFTRLAPEVYDGIYADGPDVILAGGLLPKGRAVPDGDGYRFTGQWPFASGCTHADYIAVNAFVDQTGTADGAPMTRFCVIPAADAEILDTWHVNGLKGTASHDVALDDHYVPGAWTGDARERPPVVRQPRDGLPLLARLGLDLTAVALGIARGALGDLAEVARTKRPVGGLVPRRLAEDRVFQHTVGNLATDLEMVRVLVRHVAREDDAVAASGIDPDPAWILARRAMLSRAASVSASVVDGCYVASGTTGLFESSPLQRRLRDVRAVTQHAVIAVNPFTPVGASVLGEPLPAGMF